jgi:hypothetical protein
LIEELHGRTRLVIEHFDAGVGLLREDPVLEAGLAEDSTYQAQAGLAEISTRS